MLVIIVTTTHTDILSSAGLIAFGGALSLGLLFSIRIPCPTQLTSEEEEEEETAENNVENLTNNKAGDSLENGGGKSKNSTGNGSGDLDPRLVHPLARRICSRCCFRRARAKQQTK